MTTAADHGFVVNDGLPRVLDVAVALTALTALSAVLGLIAVLIKLTSPGPVLFRQLRAGRGGRLFSMVKFRTMANTHTGPKVTAEGDLRITPVGAVLRRTKLDELPELWNVLTGSMALVGPRPEVPEFVDPKDGRWRAVLEARPGLTDPVTIALRNEQQLLATIEGDREHFYREILIPQKLDGYLRYLAVRSWRTDVGVLLATAVAIVRPAAAASQYCTAHDSCAVKSVNQGSKQLGSL